MEGDGGYPGGVSDVSVTAEDRDTSLAEPLTRNDNFIDTSADIKPEFNATLGSPVQYKSMIQGENSDGETKEQIHRQIWGNSSNNKETKLLPDAWAGLSKNSEVLQMSKYREYATATEYGFKCDVCDKEYSNLNAIGTHLTTTHDDVVDTLHLRNKAMAGLRTSSTEKSPTRGESKYAPFIIFNRTALVCVFCQITYSDLNGMRYHLIRKHRKELIETEGVTGSKFPDPVSAGATSHETSKYAEYINKTEGSLECKLCGRDYPALNPLRRHIRLHLESNENQKEYRPRRMTMKEREIINEMMIKVGDEFQCVKCGEKYSKHGSLRQHVVRNHYIKPATEIQTVRRSKYGKEFTDLISICGDIFQCIDCGLLYKNYESLRKHILRLHKDILLTAEVEEIQIDLRDVNIDDYFERCEGQAQCLICLANMKNEATLSLHLRRHLKIGYLSPDEAEGKWTQCEDGFQCTACRSVFSSDFLLLLHLKWHTVAGVVRVRCDYCTGAILISNMENHMLTKHKDLIPNRTCPVCLDKIPLTDYKAHKRTHRGQEKMILGPTWLCERCGAQLGSKAALRKHVDVQHAAPEKCDKCNLCGRDVRRSLMQRHMQNHASGQELYACDKCGKDFISKGNLRRHVVIVHPGSWTKKCYKHECHMCGKFLTTHDSLKQHLNMHAGIKPYVCDMCGLAFRGTSGLKRHQLVHSDVKKHVCQYCGKKFRNRGTCKRHMCLHTGEKPYRCAACDRGFIHKYHYLQHSCNSRPRQRKSQMAKHVVDFEPTSVVDAVHTIVPPVFYEPREYQLNGTYFPAVCLGVNKPLEIDAMTCPGHLTIVKETQDAINRYSVVHQVNVLDIEKPPFIPQNSQITTKIITGQDAFEQFLTSSQLMRNASTESADGTPCPLAEDQLLVATASKSPEPTASTSNDSAIPKITCTTVTPDIADCSEGPEWKVEKLILKIPKSWAQGKKAKESDDSSEREEELEYEIETEVSESDEDFVEANKEIDDNDDSDTEVDDVNSNGWAVDNEEAKDSRSTNDSDGKSDHGVDCVTCGKTFRNKKGLSIHLRQHPALHESTVCKVCSKPFDCKTRLEEHIRTHTGEKPYMCDLCDRAFRTKSCMTVHRRTHTGDKPYVCDLCGQGFVFRSGWKRHLVRTHKMGKTSAVCDVCGKDFPTTENLTRHLKVHSDSKDFVCHFCPQQYTNMSQLKKHLCSHSDDRPFVCAVCGITFKYANNLRRHELTHNTERPFSCDLCSMTCVSREVLNRHIKQVHKKTFKQCKYCDKVFSDPTTLKRHENRHLGKYSYNCSLCTKGFDKRYELERHMHVHAFGRGRSPKMMEIRDDVVPGSALDLRSRYDDQRKEESGLLRPFNAGL